MKLLILGGMHGNEPLGIEVVKLFRKKTILGVDTAYANKDAIKKNCRFVVQDLNRSFPGTIYSKIYEQKRAAELLILCRNYDIVFDFHNTCCPKNDCSFVGNTCNPLLYDIASWIGLKRVVAADYDCINKYVANCISLEISLTSKRMNPKMWYDKITKLAKLDCLPKQVDIERYRFVYRMSLKDKEKHTLENKKLKAFKPINKKLANNLGLQSPAYPIFIGDTYTPYNYGGLLNKL